MRISHQCAFSYTTKQARQENNKILSLVFVQTCTDPTVWHAGSRLQQTGLAESPIKPHMPQLHFSILFPPSFYLVVPDNLQRMTDDSFVSN